MAEIDEQAIKDDINSEIVIIKKTKERVEVEIHTSSITTEDIPDIFEWYSSKQNYDYQNEHKFILNNNDVPNKYLEN